MSLATPSSYRRLALRPLCGAALFAAACLPGGAQNSAPSVHPDATRTTIVTRPADFPALLDGGPLPGSQRLSLTLTLTPDATRSAALDQFLTDVVTPSSPSYHHWLTPQQFAASYGATADEIAAATSWLQSQGLSVDAVSPSGMRMTVSGYVAQIQSAFSTNIDTVQIGGHSYFANMTQPSLPAGSTFFNSIEGLDNLPLDLAAMATGPSATPATLIDGAPSALTIPTFAALVDANTSPLVTIDSTFGAATPSPSQIAGYIQLFRQAAAQGMTTLLTRAADSGGFPSGLDEVTAVARPNDNPDLSTPSATRPAWQDAPGLPSDNLRHSPDLTATSFAALAQGIATIAEQVGGRLGNINPTLYTLAPLPGLFTQADSAPAGTWEQGSGLGTVDVSTLVKVYPHGTAADFISFSSTNYAPVHGQSVSFTSNVTSGTGGATPTGTVTFTANGITLGVVTLTNGSATYTTNSFVGGNYTLLACYSGDATYASGCSTQSQIYVAAEPASLSVVVSGGAVVGGTFNVIVTQTSASGVGQPSGAITVTLPVNGATYSGTLVPLTATSASATITIPATIVGTITLSVACTTSVSFNCSSPYTTTIAISKATPTLNISYTPNPPVAGQGITLSATVTGVGTAPTPTGSVEFFDNGTVLNAGALNSGTTTTTGIVPNTTTHVITATYQGDPDYNSVSTSSTSTTSGAISTTISLSASASTVTLGQSIRFTAVVTPASLGSAQPTGIVQFFDNNVVLLGNGTVSNDVATFATSTLSSTVNHSITAIYVGDTNYSGSTSNVLPIGKSVTPIATTTALTSSPSTITTGQSISFTATVTPLSVISTAPTGTVQFFDGGTSLGTATLVGTSANFTTAALSGSVTHSITAVYSGDTNYSASTSPALTFNKNATTNATTTTLTATPATAGVGSSVVLSVIVSPTVNSTPPTGIVQFLTNGTLLCSGTLSGSMASCTVTTFALGTTTVTASYPGDTLYAASISNAVTVTITSSTAGLTASVSPAAVAPGGTATVTATVTAPTGTIPQGFIVATISGVAGAQYSIQLPSTLKTNTATVTIPISAPATAGSYPVIVSCSLNGVTCTTVTLTLTSSASATQTGMLSATISPAAALPNGQATVTAIVTSPVGTVPTGTISATIQQNSSNISTSQTALPGTGTTNTATITIPVAAPATVGVYSVQVNCVNTNFSCVPVNLTFTSSNTPGLVPTTTVLTAAASTTTSGATILTATVTPSIVSTIAPTGTVSFYNGTTLLGTSALSATTGTATLSVTLSTTATNSITGVYSGDTNFATSTSAAITGATTQATATVTLKSSMSSGVSGSSVVLTATVSGSVASGAAPTGTVSFYLSSPTAGLIGTVTVGTTGAGIATGIFQTSNLPSGALTIYAAYSGDTNFNSAISNSITLGIGDYALTFNPTTLTLNQGQTGTATGTIGVVSSFSGTIVLGCSSSAGTYISCSFSPATLTGAGTTKLTVTTLAPKSAAVRGGPLKAVGAVSLAALLCGFLPIGRRRRIPAMLLVLLALGLTMNLGCNGNTLVSPVKQSDSGTPLGTTILTINTTGTNGTTTVNHDYTYQVTVQ